MFNSIKLNGGAKPIQAANAITDVNFSELKIPPCSETSIKKQNNSQGFLGGAFDWLAEEEEEEWEWEDEDQDGDWLLPEDEDDADELAPPALQKRMVYRSNSGVLRRLSKKAPPNSNNIVTRQKTIDRIKSFRNLNFSSPLTGEVILEENEPPL